MATKKYLSLERLSEYDELIKAEISSGDSSTLATAKSYADGLASGKADSGHNHDGRYYTESETDNLLTNKVDKVSGKGLSTNDYTTTEKNKLAGIEAGAQVNTITGVKGNSETTYRTGNVNITKANIGLGNVDNTADANKSVNYATSAGSATSATKDASGNTITATYETKTDAAAKLTEAKTYADNAASAVKNALLNGAGAAYDTLKELGELIDDNKDAIDALEEIASGKANAVHSHAISEVTGLQSALDGKASSSHGTHVTFDSTNTPKMDGTAAFGTSSNVARADHVHPTDTSRAAQTALDSHTTNTTAHITATERTNWGTAYTHSQTAHSPSDAEKNQNAFSYVKVGETSIAADTATDTLTLVAGTNVTITPDATNDKITISATDTVYTHPTSGVTAGTYKSVTVNAQGHVTAGTNPTTLSGYGITDAASKTHYHAISDITNLQTTLNNAAQAISANTASIDTHTTKIGALETKVGDGFEEITSAEIQALFAQ